jgi:HEAT repeat protein
LISILLGFFINIRTSSIIASALCFIASAILLFSFQSSRGQDISAQNLTEALNSKRWQDRVAALKLIDEKGWEVNSYKAYPRLRTSSHLAERYWLVRTLGHSQSTATYADLLDFLNDPHPNIVSMALYAIGKRGKRQAIDQIMQIIAASDDWYTQWYAYKALRSIGWRQTKSN